MNDAELLRLYDEDERINARYPRVRREATGAVVRHVALDEGEGFIVYSALTDADADAAIEEQIAYFEGIGQSFEWKVYGHDCPPDLRERLLRRGFTLDDDDDEALLILDLNEAPPALLAPTRHDIRRVTRPEDVAEALSVQAAVWQQDYSVLAARLATDLRDHPDILSVYAVWADGRPVSSAWLYLLPGSHFGGLWGGSTLPDYRGQGIYTALVGARAREARERGLRFLTIDASPMSRPIVQKLGFRFMTLTYPCKWRTGV